MTLSIVSGLSMLLLLVALQVLVSAIYFVFSTVRKKHLKEQIDEGNRRAQRTLNFLEQMIQVVLTYEYISIILTMFSGVIVVWTFSTPLEKALKIQDTPSLALVILIPLGGVIYMFLGHQLPRATLSGRPEGFAIQMTPFTQTLVKLLSPLLSLSQTLSFRLGKLLGGAGEISQVTEEEIKSLVDVGSEEGVIEDEEKDMIYSVFRFGDTLVREVMVPRIDVVAIGIETSLEDALDTIIRVGHSRIPVYEGSIDNVIGFLYAKDLLILMHKNETPNSLSDLLRDPYFVPETKKADELLDEFRTLETHIAIVSDQYGGTAGLVTVEDLIEEIVGEIRDEYDFFEEAAYEQISENEYICSAGLDLDDLNELLDTSIPTEISDTIGGFIFSELGKVPEVGDKITYHNIEMEVLTLKNERRINKVRVVKHLDDETEPQTNTPVEGK